MKFQLNIDNTIKNFGEFLKIIKNERYKILKYLSVSLISYLYVLTLLYFLVSLSKKPFDAEYFPF